jgi:hypothetical protein
LPPRPWRAGPFGPRGFPLPDETHDPRQRSPRPAERRRRRRVRRPAAAHPHPAAGHLGGRPHGRGQQELTNAAREGGRQASTGQLSDSQVQAAVTQYLQVAGLPTANVVVTVQDLSTPALDVSQANYLDNVQVAVTISISDIRWSLISLVTSPGQTMSATVQWTTMVDKPYPSSPTPPVG